MQLARLVLLGEDGDNPPEELPKYIPLDKERTTVGRSRSADLTLDSITYPCTLSRVHVVIWRRLEDEEDNTYSWGVTDCGSLNGTFINFVKVKEEQLQDGDTLTLGGGAGLEEGERSDCLASDLVFRFEAPEGIMPISTTRATNNSRALSPLDANAVAHPTPERQGDRPKTAVVNGDSSRLGKRLAKVDSPSQEDSKTGDGNGSAGSLSASSGSEKGHKRQRVSRSPLPEDNVDVELNKNLKDEFKCAVCQDFFVESTTLNCGHTFCSSCIMEWFSRSQKCPTCRAECSMRPVKSNALDCAVRHIVKCDPQVCKEYEKRLQKASRDKASRRRSLESLAKRIRETKDGDHQFLRITEDWEEDDRVTFDSGVNNYRGVAREEYCRATGLTEQFLELATLEDLTRTARNVRLTNGGMDASALRRRLHMFIMFG
jgi:hypothetical protein